ncbi:MAG: hypothetical protein ABSH56_35550 [Bryobacteraceae bacterium]|jgi:ABC-type transporter Mla subunit MlaD
MTTEERLERIENGWIDIQQALKAVIQVQANTNERIDSLAESLKLVIQVQTNANERIDGLAESLKIVIQIQTNTNERISVLVESIGQYVDASDARTRRLEDNLDALIRAITAEHSNGKSKS